MVNIENNSWHGKLAIVDTLYIIDSDYLGECKTYYNKLLMGQKAKVPWA